MCRFTPRIRPRRRETTSTLAPAALRARSGTISSTFSKPSAARTAILRPLSRRLVGTSSPVARWRSFPSQRSPRSARRRAAHAWLPAQRERGTHARQRDTSVAAPRGGRAGDGGVRTWSRQCAQACEKPAIALAELGSTEKRNATEIVGNVAAMRAALALADRLDADAILAMHAALMGAVHPGMAGKGREEQGWIRGAAVGPHPAGFPPPPPAHLPAPVHHLV